LLRESAALFAQVFVHRLRRRAPKGAGLRKKAARHLPVHARFARRTALVCGVAQALGGIGLSSAIIQHAEALLGGLKSRHGFNRRGADHCCFAQPEIDRRQPGIIVLRLIDLGGLSQSKFGLPPAANQALRSGQAHQAFGTPGIVLKAV